MLITEMNRVQVQSSFFFCINPVTCMHQFEIIFSFIGGYNQKTDWHRICVFKPNLRDNVYNYLRKGQRVHVKGKILYGEVKDESGDARTTTSILADDVIFFQQ